MAILTLYCLDKLTTLSSIIIRTGYCRKRDDIVTIVYMYSTLPWQVL